MNEYNLSEVPSQPGVYTLIDQNTKVAYVGISKDLRERINQHLYKRDSSIVTGVSTTMLNPDQVARVDYWVHPIFDDKNTREAAELIAFKLFSPALRSRGNISKNAQAKTEDELFVRRIEHILEDPPHGHHIPQNTKNLWQLCTNLREEVSRLQVEVEKLKRRT